MRPKPIIRDNPRIGRIPSVRMWIVPSEGAIRADAIRSDPIGAQVGCAWCKRGTEDLCLIFAKNDCSYVSLPKSVGSS